MLYLKRKEVRYREGCRECPKTHGKGVNLHFFTKSIPGTVQHKFRKWVTAEVLPAIRKTGSYQQPGAGTSRRPESLRPIAREFRAALRLARGMGLRGRQAVQAAGRLACDQTGFNPLELFAADLPGREKRKPEKSFPAPLTGLVSRYLDMLEVERQAGRNGIQFTEKEDGQLEAVITMRDLLGEFNAIADRYSAIKARYCSAKQLAARCMIERELIEKAGWAINKSSKVNGIYRYLLIRNNDKTVGYPQETAAPPLTAG